MKNMLKLFAIIYFIGSIVIAVASAVTYSIAVSNMIKAMDDDDENATIEILEKDVKEEL